jgi:uncharacterized protein YcnI
MRRAVFVLTVLVGLVVTAGVASAHVEVEADPPQTSAQNATLTFTAEAESSTAGITRLEIAPPSGFDTKGVTLASAPDGWTLAETDLGFAFSGPALKPGEELEAAAKVPQLPSTTETQLKALVTYSDGHVDRWIEERQDGQPEPENPTALLTLEQGAESGSTTSTTAADSTSTTAADQTTTTVADDSEDDDSSSALPWIIGVIVLAAIIAAVVYALSRRRGGSNTTP